MNYMYIDVCILIYSYVQIWSLHSQKKILAVERSKTSTAKKNLWLWKFENLHSQKYSLAVEPWNPRMAVELVRTRPNPRPTVSF